MKEGANWEPHWSFNVPEKPNAPSVKRPNWVRNPIDQLVLARLEAEGLEPAEEADARTLARRLSLDLTGLPPSPDTVEAFVSDPTEEAYQALIDTMLESTSYGEHRARYWLDAARYGDTHGLHFDNYREMWPYRDWVVEAFNRNQPFERVHRRTAGRRSARQSDPRAAHRHWIPTLQHHHQRRGHHRRGESGQLRCRSRADRWLGLHGAYYKLRAVP